MTLIDFLRMVRERWMAIVACLVLGTGGAFLATVGTPSQFEAGTSLFVTAGIGGDDATAVYEGTLLAQQRIASYTELATSERVLRETAEALGEPAAVAGLADRVSTSTSADTVIMDLTVVADSPENAARTADTLADVLIATVADLEEPRDGAQVTTITLRQINPAVARSAPISPSPVRNLALGAVIGLLVGVGTAYLRHVLDRSVKDPAQLAAVISAPVLGTVARRTKLVGHPLTVHEHQNAGRAEAFRQLRIRLQSARIDDSPRVIAVTSALAGEGKTTTVCNLAIAMADAGRRVLVIEADLRGPRMSELLGVDPSVGLTTVLSDESSLPRAVQKWWGGTFDVLGSGPLPSDPSELLGSHRMAELLATASAAYDVVLLDTPPLLPVAHAAALAAFADGLLLVVRHGRTRVEQLRATVETIRSVPTPLLGAVLSMAPMRGSIESYHHSYIGSGRVVDRTRPRSEPPAAPRAPGHWAPAPGESIVPVDADVRVQEERRRSADPVAGTDMGPR